SRAARGPGRPSAGARGSRRPRDQPTSCTARASATRRAPGCRDGCVAQVGSEPMSAVLDLQDVTVRRGTKTILDHVTWTVADGERWVLLGSNGAGKTTLL